MEIIIIAIIIVAIIFGVLGNLIGTSRGNGYAGAVSGAALGPVGLVAAFFMKGHNVCPSCKTSNHLDACKCKGCGDTITPKKRVWCPSCQKQEYVPNIKAQYRCASCQVFMIYPTP